jgi:hypothetical protein
MSIRLKVPQGLPTRIGRLSMVAVGFPLVVLIASTHGIAQGVPCDQWFDRAPLAQPRNSLASAVAGAVGDAFSPPRAADPKSSAPNIVKKTALQSRGFLLIFILLLPARPQLGKSPFGVGLAGDDFLHDHALVG